MSASEKGKSVKVVEPGEDGTTGKPQKAKGPPPAAVPITKRSNGPPKAVLKKPSAGVGGAVM